MRVVLCNVPPDAAGSIADELVQRRLAACVTATAVTSTYRWQGAVQHDAEVTLTIKVSPLIATSWPKPSFIAKDENR